MTAASQRRYRERQKAGLAVFRVELGDADVEELLRSFGASSLQELVEGLIELDHASVKHNGARLADVVLSWAEELPKEV